MIGKNTPQNRLSCQSLMEWHDWLKDHHDKEPEVWLQIQKAGSTQIRWPRADTIRK